MHKIKGHRSSGILFIFWLILLIFATPQLRSEIRNSDKMSTWMEFQFFYYVTYFTLITIMLFLNCFADKAPRISTYLNTSNNPSPEKSASFLNQLFFHWFLATVWKGWRRPLTEKDIHDINQENTSRELVPKFDKYFAESIEKNKKADLGNSKTTNGSILPVIVKAYSGPFWFSGFLMIFIIVFVLSMPFLLDELITFVTVPNAPLWQGFLLSFGLFLTTTLTAIFDGQYFWRTMVVSLRIRTGLISAIYRKALKISSAAKKQTTVGEIVNLMSVDAQNFSEMISYLHDLWSAPLMIGIATWLLWRLIGVAVFAGLAVMILMIPTSGVIASKLQKLQVTQMEIKDERVKSMNEILNGMKVLKLNAWEPSFEYLILGVRNKELAILRKAAIFNAGSYFAWSLTPFLVSLVSYCTFVMLGGKLDPNIAFVSMTLFNIIAFPMEISK